jgi:osmotically-inducible protein OsmY
MCEKIKNNVVRLRSISGYIMLLLFIGIMVPSGPVCAQTTGIPHEEQIADHRITSAVETALLFDEAVSSHLIDVSTADGVVTLSGSVDNVLAEDRAVKIAGTVKGVRSVIDKLIVAALPRPDSELKGDVEKALLSDPATDSFQIRVKVKDGVVTLAGTVESWAEKKLTEKVAKGVRGVKAVENKISVNYAEDRSDTEIEADIARRLQTDVMVNSDLIDLKVKDGNVKLSGVVGSAAEQRRAVSDARVAGVESVKADFNIEWWARDRMRRARSDIFLQDNEIKDAVRDAFLYDPRVLSFKPNVRVEDGVVTLTGTVDNLAAKRAAEDTAMNTIGVWRVVNLLRVRPKDRLADEKLTQEIARALGRDPFVERHEIDVSVLNGKAYLYGTVDAKFEKKQARQVASQVNGVIEVANNLDVRPIERKADFRIRQDVIDQLWWSPFVDADQVFVQVDEGTVTLTGKVDTFYERRAAAENARQAGAQDVLNKLSVRLDRTPTWF